jgi:hypothetical protein
MAKSDPGEARHRKIRFRRFLAHHDVVFSIQKIEEPAEMRPGPAHLWKAELKLGGEFGLPPHRDLKEAFRLLALDIEDTTEIRVAYEVPDVPLQVQFRDSSSETWAPIPDDRPDNDEYEHGEY